MNNRGIKFIHERSLPMDVDSLDRAEKVLHQRITERDARIAAGNPLDTDTTGAFARGLAWVIGFDHLIEDRKAIHHVVDKVVAP